MRGDQIRVEVPRSRSFYCMIGCGSRDGVGVASLSLSACRKMYDEIIGGGEQSACEFGVRIDEFFAAKSRGETRQGRPPFRRFRNAVVGSRLPCLDGVCLGFGSCNRNAGFERRCTGINACFNFNALCKGFTPHTSLSYRLCVHNLNGRVMRLESS